MTFRLAGLVYVTFILEADEAELAQVQQLIEGALDDLVGFRSAEGQVLAEEFGMRIGIIRDLLHQVTAMDPERVQGVKTRLEKGLAALQTEVDQNRFEQELIYYIEKYDIAEEKGNHELVAAPARYQRAIGDDAFHPARL